MSLGDLSNPEAVRSAMAEHDQLGREAFLAKYGFGPARTYQVVHDGKRYDPKALIGAAHGYEFPDRGPLRVGDFSGGEQAANRKLSELGFAVERSAEDDQDQAPRSRNPTWTRDELVLAFDFYMRYRPAIPGQTSLQVAELSALLNQLWSDGEVADAGRFRNANGVYMKLMNFRRFDPVHTDAGHVGLQRGGKAEEQVWRTFAPDPVRLRAAADAIRAAVASGEVPLLGAADDDEMTEAPEGRLLTSQHRRRERNRKLVDDRKPQALKRYGRLECEACGFDFEARYGERGRGFIECHHTRPVHTLVPGDVTRLVDLALMCANCHRMIHASRPWLSVDELRAILSGA